MKNENLTFKDVYELPLRTDANCDIYIWSANGVVAFSNLLKDRVYLNEILDILNGVSKRKVTNKVSYDKGCIKIDDTPIFLIRGWGYLTGAGKLNLFICSSKSHTR